MECLEAQKLLLADIFEFGNENDPNLYEAHEHLTMCAKCQKVFHPARPKEVSAPSN